jgi:hypothetical protein
MRPGSTMRSRWIGMLVAVLLAAPTVVACSDTGECLVPLQTSAGGPQLAAAAGPDGGGGQPPDAAGACPIRVEYDGRLYEDTRATSLLYDAWGMSGDDLAPIGHASRSTLGSFTYLDDTVYAIRTVDPIDAIAMRDRSPSGIVVLVKDRDRFPIALCRYLTKPPPAAPAPCPPDPLPS